MREISGTIQWQQPATAVRSKRVADAALLFEIDGTSHGEARSNAEGAFRFEIDDKATKLIIEVLHPDAKSSKSTVTLDAATGPIDLILQPVQSHSTLAGGITFFAAVIALLIAIGVYRATHATDAMALKAQFDKAVQLIDTLPPLSELRADYGPEVNSLSDLARGVEMQGFSVGAQTRSLIAKMANLSVASPEKQIEELISAKVRARAELLETERHYLWTSFPKLFYEVWFWGVFGILVRKVLITGWYLRTSSFLPDGIWMHVSHVVATPLLAIVAVLLLSLVQFKSGSQIVIDFSDPILMVVVAFVLSTNPWGLWNFVLNKNSAIRGEKAKEG